MRPAAGCCNTHQVWSRAAALPCGRAKHSMPSYLQAAGDSCAARSERCKEEEGRDRQASAEGMLIGGEQKLHVLS